MFVNVGPAASNISESVDSLAYGDLVKNITNEKVSADADLEEQLRFLQVQCQCHSHDNGGAEHKPEPPTRWISTAATRCSHGLCSRDFCCVCLLVRAYEAKFGALDA